MFSNEQNFTDGNIVDERSLSKPYSIAIEPAGNAPRLFNLNAAWRYIKLEEYGRSVSIDFFYDLDAMIVRFDIKYKMER